MAKKKPRPHVGNPADPESLSVLAEAWLTYLEVRNYSRATVQSRRHDLLFFLAWCNERSLGRASDITRAILTSYQHALAQPRSTDDKPLSFTTQRARLSALKLFFQWIARTNV